MQRPPYLLSQSATSEDFAGGSFTFDATAMTEPTADFDATAAEARAQQRALSSASPFAAAAAAGYPDAGDTVSMDMTPSSDDADVLAVLAAWAGPAAGAMPAGSMLAGPEQQQQGGWAAAGLPSPSPPLLHNASQLATGAAGFAIWGSFCALYPLSLCATQHRRPDCEYASRLPVRHQYSTSAA